MAEYAERLRRALEVVLAGGDTGGESHSVRIARRFRRLAVRALASHGVDAGDERTWDRSEVYHRTTGHGGGQSAPTLPTDDATRRELIRLYGSEHEAFDGACAAFFEPRLLLDGEPYVNRHGYEAAAWHLVLWTALACITSTPEHPKARGEMLLARLAFAINESLHRRGGHAAPPSLEACLRVLYSMPATDGVLEFAENVFKTGRDPASSNWTCRTICIRMDGSPTGCSATPSSLPPRTPAAARA